MSKFIKSDLNSFHLPDGRVLSYAVFGQENGQPFFFFHGIPGSRLQRPPDLEIYKKLPVLFYAIDRPGYGDSTFYKNRKLLDWPADMAAFADGLGIEKFSVVGISGGGPYALACAYKIPQRLLHVLVLSGLAPLDVEENFLQLSPGGRLLFRAAKNTPTVVEQLMALLFKRLDIKLDDAFQKFMTDLPESDKELLSEPNVAQMLHHDVAEAFKQGTKGVVYDISILQQAWGFSLDKIHLPVQIWHGAADTIVPLPLGQYNINNLTAAVPHIIQNEGHFMALARMGEIFSSIM